MKKLSRLHNLEEGGGTTPGGNRKPKIRDHRDTQKEALLQILEKSVIGHMISFYFFI